MLFVFRAVTLFLSTPSARRATSVFCLAYVDMRISIHALREEGDGLILLSAFIVQQFLSTPSARRATFSFYRLLAQIRISIHALREEGDCKNGEKHLRFCFIIKRSAQIWKSVSQNIRKNSCDLHRTA